MPKCTRYIADINQFLEQFTKNQPRPLFFQLAPHQIVSESDFITETKCQEIIRASLNLLKKKAPNYYALFCLFNKKIRVVDNLSTATANFKDNTIDYSSSMINEDPSTLIAAGIIHETIHFWQMESGSSVFLKYLEPGKWKRINHQQRELEAIRHEIQVLKLVGANRAEIKRNTLASTILL